MDPALNNRTENLQPILQKCLCKWEILPLQRWKGNLLFQPDGNYRKENSKQQVRERDFNRSLEIQFRDDDSEEDGRR